jgi:hypothetical protein
MYYIKQIFFKIGCLSYINNFKDGLEKKFSRFYLNAHNNYGDECFRV